MEEIFAAAAAVVVFVVFVGVPVWLTGRLFRRLVRRRQLLAFALGERGSVHQFDMPLTFATILFGAGAVFGGLSFFPALIWLVDGDTEARRVFLALWPVVGGFVALAALAVRPGLRFLIAEPDRLTVHRTGITHRAEANPRRERAIGHAEIVAFHERRTLLPSLDVRGDGATSHIRINGQVTAFDQLVAALRQAAPHAPYTSFRDPTADATTPVDREPARTRFAVPKTQTRTLIGFLAALLVFLLAWPWFLVTGEHPTRDSIIFMAIGTGMWAVIAGLVGAENFQRRQPAELELRPGAIAWRTFLGDWRVRPVRDVVTATVETDIIYVKGFPGYRHPFRLRFVDGEELLIDDARARHLRTSTQQIGAALRRHVVDLDHRSEDDRRRADELDAEAAALSDGTTAGDARAAPLVRAAIAAYPDAARLATLAAAGDLHRRIGEHDLAVSLYRFHLDHDAHDADAWQGLAASFRAKGRDDLAAEATEHAERILLGHAG